MQLPGALDAMDGSTCSFMITREVIGRFAWNAISGRGQRRPTQSSHYQHHHLTQSSQPQQPPRPSQSQLQAKVPPAPKGEGIHRRRCVMNCSSLRGSSRPEHLRLLKSAPIPTCSDMAQHFGGFRDGARVDIYGRAPPNAEPGTLDTDSGPTDQTPTGDPERYDVLHLSDSAHCLLCGRHAQAGADFSWHKWMSEGRCAFAVPVCRRADCPGALPTKDPQPNPGETEREAQHSKQVTLLSKVMLTIQFLAEIEAEKESPRDEVVAGVRQLAGVCRTRALSQGAAIGLSDYALEQLQRIHSNRSYKELAQTIIEGLDWETLAREFKFQESLAGAASSQPPQVSSDPAVEVCECCMAVAAYNDCACLRGECPLCCSGAEEMEPARILARTSPCHHKVGQGYCSEACQRLGGESQPSPWGGEWAPSPGEWEPSPWDTSDAARSYLHDRAQAGASEELRHPHTSKAPPPHPHDRAQAGQFQEQFP